MKAILRDRLSKIILLFIFIYSLVILGHNSFLKYNGYRFKNTSWEDLFFFMFLMYWIVTAGYFLLLSKGIAYSIKKNLSNRIIIPCHIFLILTFSAFVQIPYDAIDSLFFDRHWVTTKSYLGVMIDISLWHLDRNLLLYISVVFLTYLYLIMEKHKGSELHSLNLKQAVTKARLSQLQANINPHFLFNALNNISALIKKDNEPARNAVADLGEILNQIVNDNEEVFSTVQSELLLVNRYIEVIKLRFGDHVIYTAKVDPELLQTKIPKFLIQPLIENAIKHGMSEKKVLLIKLEIEAQGEELIISVKNNGLELKFLNMKKNKGTGLRNIQERLDLLYHANYEFSIANSENNDWVVAKIRIKRENLMLTTAP